VLLPNYTASAVQAYAQNPDVTILRNDGTAQGVKDKIQLATGAIFWTDTTAGVGLITANRKAAVVAQETAATATLDVSTADLTEANTGTISVSLARSATGYTLGAGVSPAAVTMTQLSPYIKFAVNVNDSKGRSFPLQFTGVAPVVLTPTKDAYVRDGTYANDNYGGSSTLFATTASTNYSKHTYLQFDVTAFRDVEKATLRLYGNNSQDTTALLVKAYGAASTAWTETGTGAITWNNAPALASGTPLATTTVTATPGYYEWDVTAFVRAQINAGASQVTLVLYGDARNFQANSREAASNRPQLVLQ
jgi:hyaluronate lyase